MRRLGLSLALACCLPAVAAEGIRFSIEPGLAVPQPAALKTAVEGTLRHPVGATPYVRQGERLVPVVQRPLEQIAATVGSFDPQKGKAVVAIEFPGYRAPLAQVWRFDAGGWTNADRLGRGEFVR
jgi:hypothetical protein